ncbi:MAG: AsmA family protein [Rhizomicrobium sp.]
MNRKLLYGSVAGGLALLVALVAAVPLLVPTTSLRGEIEARVSRATGRVFKIHGPLAVSLFPSIGLDAQDVTLSNVPGGKARDMVQVKRMRIAVRLWPLFSGRVEAREIALESPRIALEVARDGSANWELTGDRGTGGGLDVPSRTTFDGVTIRGGAVAYDNALLGLSRTLENLDAKVAITQLGLPLGATGAVSYLGRRLGYTAKIATLKSLLDGNSTKVDLALSADFLHAAFLGYVSADGTAKGSVSLRTRSLKDLAAWIGHPVSAGSGLGPLTVLADLAARDRRIVLTAIRAKLDGMAVQGALTADTRDKVPLVAATLDIDRLDLNTYLGPATKAAGKGAGRGPPSGGWSKTPVKLDLIKLLDGHLTLTVGRLDVLHLKAAKTTIAVALDGGRMTAHLAPMALYDGTGKADLTVDGRGAVPLLANKLVFSAIAMRPFLADTIGVDKLDGRGTITLDVTSRAPRPTRSCARCRARARSRSAAAACAASTWARSRAPSRRS